MHIVFLNPQGNFDRLDSYWTMHPDFGGQLVYVKEIAIEMAKLGHSIDIITRQMDDKKFTEFKEQFDNYEDVLNCRIVRIPCGPKQFLNKELLWEHLDEWTDNIITFYENENKVIDFATGHYGDGGLACAMLKQKRNIPYSFTGHSLGAQKFDKLNEEFKNYQELEKKYHFTKRILAERTAIKHSDIVFVSTTQERDEQYSHKLYRSIQDEKTINSVVSPPGANITVFASYKDVEVDPNFENVIQSTLNRDLDESRVSLPSVILASRLDPKKNHVGFLQAYAKSQELQETCNVLISLRGVENAYQDYSNLKPEEIKIVDEMMDLIQSYNLQGKVCFMSINSQKELADTYRYIAKNKGVFTLTALYEPFGLAPIEAMSTGLPVAVTKYGGPSEVLAESGEQFGVLLDVHDEHHISEGMLQLFKHYSLYQKQGKKRVLSKYTWRATAKMYVRAIEDSIKNKVPSEVEIPSYFITKKKDDLDHNFILDVYEKERGAV